MRTRFVVSLPSFCFALSIRFVEKFFTFVTCFIIKFKQEIIIFYTRYIRYHYIDLCNEEYDLLQFNLSDFCDTWQQAVPEGTNTSLYQLEVCLISLQTPVSTSSRSVIYPSKHRSLPARGLSHIPPNTGLYQLEVCHISLLTPVSTSSRSVSYPS